MLGFTTSLLQIGWIEVLVNVHYFEFYASQAELYCRTNQLQLLENCLRGLNLLAHILVMHQLLVWPEFWRNWMYFLDTVIVKFKTKVLLYITFKQRRMTYIGVTFQTNPCSVLLYITSILNYSLFFFLIISASDEMRNRTGTDHYVCFHVQCNFQFNADIIVFMKEMSKHMYDNGFVIYIL